MEWICFNKYHMPGSRYQLPLLPNAKIYPKENSFGEKSGKEINHHWVGRLISCVTFKLIAN